VAALRSLEQDLSTIRAVVAKEDARIREEETAEARKALNKLHAQEEEIWRRTGEAFAELVACWNDYLEVAARADSLLMESGLDGRVLVEPASRRARCE
jgi:hypothetical protein